MDQPWIEILEEPHPKDHRFRYKCEGKPGGMPGANSTLYAKTFPTIKIHNMGQEAVVVISCVTTAKPNCPHPHSLIGQGCDDKGVCTIRVRNGEDVIRLIDVGVQCCRRQDIKESLEKRKQLRVDPFKTGYDCSVNTISLNSVRLCFQAFLLDEDQKFTKVVAPVVSQEVHDKRSFHSLEIHRLSRLSAHAEGQEELFIFCDKIKKNDISVRFFQEDTAWEGFGSFGPSDVHGQCALVCQTPSYPHQTLPSPISAWIQLVRPSDGMAGGPKQFHFIRNEPDTKTIIAGKKRKAENWTVSASTSKTTSLVPLMMAYSESQPLSGAMSLGDVIGYPASSGTLLTHYSSDGSGLEISNRVRDFFENDEDQTLRSMRSLEDHASENGTTIIGDIRRQSVLTELHSKTTLTAGTVLEVSPDVPPSLDDLCELNWLL